jgi:hypothetical protein
MASGQTPGATTPIRVGTPVADRVLFPSHPSLFKGFCFLNGEMKEQTSHLQFLQYLHFRIPLCIYHTELPEDGNTSVVQDPVETTISPWILSGFSTPLIFISWFHTCLHLFSVSQWISVARWFLILSFKRPRLPSAPCSPPPFTSPSHTLAFFS